MYRKSIDGDSYEIFHKLCDNKGPTLILIKSNENFIIGGYTPLNWDMNGEWKVDNDTFLFNLTNNKIFRKKEKMKKSIFCSKECGPWFPFIGFLGLGKKNMSQGVFFYKTDNNWIYFNDINNIIPNEGKDLSVIDGHKIFCEILLLIFSRAENLIDLLNNKNLNVA